MLTKFCNFNHFIKKFLNKIIQGLIYRVKLFDQNLYSSLFKKKRRSACVSLDLYVDKYLMNFGYVKFIKDLITKNELEQKKT